MFGVLLRRDHASPAEMHIVESLSTSYYQFLSVRLRIRIDRCRLYATGLSNDLCFVQARYSYRPISSSVSRIEDQLFTISAPPRSRSASFTKLHMLQTQRGTSRFYFNEVSNATRSEESFCLLRRYMLFDLPTHPLFSLAFGNPQSLSTD